MNLWIDWIDQRKLKEQSCIGFRQSFGNSWGYNQKY